MPTEYNKLVRDRIPEIIREDGQQCQVEAMTEGEYKRALLQKLVEEAQEASGADGRQALVTELADLREVMAATADAFGIGASEIAAEQKRRRETRGGFARRLRLVWTE